jgi:hypothetical protein
MYREKDITIECVRYYDSAVASDLLRRETTALSSDPLLQLEQFVGDLEWPVEVEVEG